ncbi:3-hydroxyacyl-CoA dehydrogenase [Glaciimonas sp. PAMC28666]|uniref:3-hydroxyacyl-CoA dehydrogenase n=1 Tax=Glaciimonas sp. PAMC28666 TaxID=2807626 RepID=UPI0019662001|nr:3-hydroxyacyl-CoA dehydrogenase [Glaciimonas sp. PAMC28666]QRX81773.1 3-hydroxyacyl-CoA dehydrogenase [Glaciimonas sp. PAMC28666]
MNTSLILGIVGAGAMGRGIAQIAAIAGIQVKLYDRQAGAADDAHHLITLQLRKLQEKGRLTDLVVDAAINSIARVNTLDAFQNCDIVIEAIVENLDAKRELLGCLEGIVGPDCIFASNTSSLSVTAIAAAATHPDRVAGLHFFNPVPLLKLVEVIPGLLTAEPVVQFLIDFVHKMGHKPVRATDTPGFIVNHASRGYLTEALRIVQENAANFAQIDEVMREAAGFRLGPFELLDLTGLDVSHPVMESIYQQYYHEPRYRPSVITAQRLGAGLLGRKSGRGFYCYENGVIRKDAVPVVEAPAQPWSGAVWVARADPRTSAKIEALLSRCGAILETGQKPSAAALCLVVPMGEDVSTCVLRERLDAPRTLGIDTLTDCYGRLTLMSNPATDRALAQQAQALLARSGQAVTLIKDSYGFILQRVLAIMVNIGCDIAQQGICTPEDLDCAVETGLAYPRGPLAWGDHIGADQVLTILKNLHQTTGDPRYRPSPWLMRRAQLGLSLRHSDN